MKFILNKDDLEIKETHLLNSGSTKYYEATVEYDEQWKRLTIVAVMTKKGESIGKNIAVINNRVYIDEDISGTYLIGFVGYTIENEQKTYQISTNLKSIYFNKGAGEIQTQNEIVPTPSEWEIYVSQLQTIVDDMKAELHIEVEEVEEKLENGDFNGKSAYEVAIDNGFEGTETEWLASLEGKQGDRGDSGIVAFELREGNLIAISEAEENINKFKISNGHMILEI